VKTYYLHIKDNDDAEYDMHLHYSHPTKTASDLWGDYESAYTKATESDNSDWAISDILDELEKMGWSRVDLEKVVVEY
jgi:hypothetical protein